jgi:esterase
MPSARFIPHAEPVVASGAHPAAWMLVLHGIFGSATNLRTLASRLAAARPAWGFLLVDLRGHGQSQGAPPPHTVAAVAEDLIRLDGELGLAVQGIAGHSFGGKVALAYAERRREALSEVWILDAEPGARGFDESPGSARDVLRLLEEVPQPLPSRRAFLERVEPRLGQATALWLAMSLRREDGRYRLILDLVAIRALLDDHARLDLWRVVEDPALARVIRFVVGGRSPVVSEADRRRLAASVRVDTLEQAGHWLHVDDLEGLLAAMSRGRDRKEDGDGRRARP